jgi:hypothetical protein
MSEEKTYEIMAAGSVLLWISGVGMLVAGIWIPSWQWAATGVLAILLGFAGLWLAQG